MFDDLIDERDRKARMTSSVIKFWNVRYLTKEQAKELEEQKKAKEQEEAQPAPQEVDEDLRRAQEIFERLEAEAAEDEARKIAEQRAAYEAVQASMTDENYNATTGSYSGAYGKGHIDESTKDMAAAILSEKSDSIAALFEQAEQSLFDDAQDGQ